MFISNFSITSFNILNISSLGVGHVKSCVFLDTSTRPSCSYKYKALINIKLSKSTRKAPAVSTITWWYYRCVRLFPPGIGLLQCFKEPACCICLYLLKIKYSPLLQCPEFYLRLDDISSNVSLPGDTFNMTQF